MGTFQKLALIGFCPYARKAPFRCWRSGEKKENEGPDDRSEDNGSLPTIPSSLLPDSADGGRRITAGASCPATPLFSEARNGGREETQGADEGITCFNSGEFMSREGIFEATMGHMRTGTYVAAAAAAEVLIRTWRACSREEMDTTILTVVDMLASNACVLKSAAARVILHVYVEDEQRLACVIRDYYRHNPHQAEQMQGDALAALLSLCEHPDVPGVLARDRGLAILAEYLTIARDVATRCSLETLRIEYVALTIMKVALVYERPAVELFLPDMVVSEHILGASEEVEAFVGTFVEKRKGFADCLRVDKDGSSTPDERELKRVLMQLKMDCTKESARKVIAVVDKNRSGVVEFDEVLDVVWNVRHVKVSAQTALLRTVGIFIGTVFAALHRSRS